MTTNNGASGPAGVRTKLEAARTRVILEQPFIGALLLHLELHASAGYQTVATDGLRLYFNPSFVGSLEMRHTQFLLAHQALHCALGHFWRRGHRARRRWDLACDYAVNLMLTDEGMAAPPGALLDVRFRGLSAEEIYPLLSDTLARSQSTLDDHLFDVAAATAGNVGHDTARDSERQADAPAGSPALSSEDAVWSDAAPYVRRNPSAGTTMEPAVSLDDLARRWQMRLAVAAQQASRSGRLGHSWQRALGRMLQPALPWSALLARHVVSRAREDYSFRRPARRESDAILPRLDSGQLDLIVILDTSGSVSAGQLDAFVAEIDALKGQVRARVTLHVCDEQLAPEGPWVFQPWEPLRLPPSLRGGAGTDFRPAFDWIRDEHLQPDLLIYFTDAEGDFPQDPPPFPVIWLVKGPAPVPWGERIQLN